MFEQIVKTANWQRKGHESIKGFHLTMLGVEFLDTVLDFELLLAQGTMDPFNVLWTGRFQN